MSIKDSLRLAFNRGSVQLGDKKTDIKKLTYVKYKQLDGVMNVVPGLAFKLMLTPKEQYYETAVAAFDYALDEVYGIVSILSEIEIDYLKEYAGITEVIDYVVLTIKKNNFAETVKNVKSLLPNKMEESKE